MKSSFRLLMAIAALHGLTGCGTLNTVKYYQLSVEADINTRKSRDGIAFSVDAACLNVESDKSVHQHAFTLVGIPLFPMSFSTPEPVNTGHFEIILWVIPEYRNTDYSFDVSQIELEFDDGAPVRPEWVQVSRFLTSVEKIPDLFISHATVRESISLTDHWKSKPPGAFEEPVELWSWTRLRVSFKRPANTSNPARLYIRGLLRDGVSQNVPVIKFSFASELRQAFSGKFADGTWIFDLPEKKCRKLQNFKAAVLSEDN